MTAHPRRRHPHHRYALVSRAICGVTLAGLAGCGRSSGDSEPAKPPPVVSDAPAPQVDGSPVSVQLPPEVLIQVRLPSGRVDRVQRDGKYLSAEDGETFAAAVAFPISGTPTPGTLSPGAIARIEEALTACGFARLPAKLPSTVPAGAVVPPRGDPPRLEPWSFTVALDETSSHTVTVTADIRVPSSFEALEPLYDRLDSEMWGNYRNE